MKRIFSLLLCLMLLLCGCSQNTTTPPAETTAAPAVTEPAPTDPPISPYAQAAIDTGTLHYYFFTGDGQTFSSGQYQTMSGDACLIFFPNGEIMLIDTSTSIGYPIFKAWLESMGVWKIDHLVLTSSASDLAGGANAGLIFDFKIGMLYHNGVRNDLLWTALENDIPYKEMKFDDELLIGADETLTTVKCVWPTQEYRLNTNPKPNLSLVLRIDYGEHSSLFTGNIYKTYSGAFADREAKGEYNFKDQLGAEEQMTALYKEGELDVDLLKLANHGNPSTSNGKALWKATTPELAVAMGFYPLDTGYITAYKAWGYKKDVLFDRKHGFIHITATPDGNMERETSREDYAEPFGERWNTEIGG